MGGLRCLTSAKTLGTVVGAFRWRAAFDTNVEVPWILPSGQ